MDNLESFRFRVPPQPPSFFRIYISNSSHHSKIHTHSFLFFFQFQFPTSKTMAFSTSTSFFTSPNFTVNHHHSSSSSSSSPASSVRYGKARSPPISANFATATTSRSPRISTTSSLYEVLGIQIGADTVEIKAAYRKLARVLHPDVGNQDSSPDDFIKVHSAYATLSDPGKRADYDRSLFVRQKPTVVRTPSPTGYGGYGGRRWETDQCW